MIDVGDTVQLHHNGPSGAVRIGSTGKVMEIYTSKMGSRVFLVSWLSNQASFVSEYHVTKVVLNHGTKRYMKSSWSTSSTKPGKISPSKILKNSRPTKITRPLPKTTSSKKVPGKTSLSDEAKEKLKRLNTRPSVNKCAMCQEDLKQVPFMVGDKFKYCPKCEG